MLAAGTPLISRPLGADGSEKNVLQYIGKDEDIAFMMFEVSEKESEYEQLTPRKPQALRLAVNTNESTHDGTKGLKVEVFVNGALSDVHLFNPKKEGLVKTYTADGTRISRQIEKPWTYQSAAALPQSKLSAETRWSSASASLKEEVHLRGVNDWGDRPPAAEFLAALAAIPLPSRLQNKAQMGIIDMVIVAGSGAKDIGSASYITRPSRFRSKKYGTGKLLEEPSQRQSSGDAQSEQNSSSPFPSREPMQIEDPFADTLGSTPAKPPLSYAAPDPLSTSPDIPLVVKQQSKPRLKLNAPKVRPPDLTATEQAAKEFAENNGIAWRQDAMIESFKDRRGVEKGKRSLTHRIADLQKMTPNHKAGVIEQLKRDFPVEKSTTPPRPATQRRIKLNLVGSNTSVAAAPSTGTSRPKARGKSEKASRTDLAIENGAAPGGNLLKRIASFSSPKKADRADTPMLGSSSSAVQTPQREGGGISVSRSSSVGDSSGQPGKLDDQTTEEALPGFQLPEACHGSVFSYAEGNAQRQIPKARPGVFEEDEVIVGMRFILI